MFERKRGAGNDHAGSKGILGREEMKMAYAINTKDSSWPSGFVVGPKPIHPQLT